jgi:hypothetical protein
MISDDVRIQPKWNKYKDMPGVGDKKTLVLGEAR